MYIELALVETTEKMHWHLHTGFFLICSCTVDLHYKKQESIPINIIWGKSYC